MRRHLSAVLIGDVVGFSRLMERDEEDTHDRLRALMTQVLEPALAVHAGRLVKTTGDGIIAVFGSATEALRCAIEIQRAVEQRNVDVRREHRIEFRFGLNVGDIIEEADDIAGDCVNLAARLEAICIPGHVCLSAVAREQVRDVADIEFVDLGPQRVKNMSRSVPAFLAVVDSKNVRRSRLVLGRLIGFSRIASARRLGIAFVAACLVVLGTAYVLMKNDDAAPDMSLAVLPFAPSSASVVAAQLASRFASRVAMIRREAVVLPPGPVLPDIATHRPGWTRSTARALNVRYLLTCDVRQDGALVRATFELIDASTGKLIASRTEEMAPDLSGVNASQALERAARTIANALVGTEERRLAGTRSNALAFYFEATQKARVSQNDSAATEVKRLLDESLRRDPNFVPAMFSKSKLLDEELPMADEQRASGIVREYLALGDRAVAADQQYATAWAIRAVGLMYSGQLQPALEAFERGLQLTPDSSQLLFGRALMLELLGRYDEALAELDLAQATLPGSANSHILGRRCEIYLMLQQPSDAIRSCQAVVAVSDSWYVQALLAAAYARKGDLLRAKAAKDRLLKLKPDYSIEMHRTAQQRYSGSEKFLADQQHAMWEPLRNLDLPLERQKEH